MSLSHLGQWWGDLEGKKRTKESEKTKPWDPGNLGKSPEKEFPTPPHEEMENGKGNGLSAAGGTRVRPHQELPGKEGDKILGWERLGLASKKKNLRVLETSHKFRASAEVHFQRMQR